MHAIAYQYVNHYMHVLMVIQNIPNKHSSLSNKAGVFVLSTSTVFPNLSLRKKHCKTTIATGLPEAHIVTFFLFSCPEN